MDSKKFANLIIDNKAIETPQFWFGDLVHNLKTTELRTVIGMTYHTDLLCRKCGICPGWVYLCQLRNASISFRTDIVAKWFAESELFKND